MDTNLPKVSVVIPTHNRKDLIKETLTSILNQTFTDFELIVVSDGSSDGTNEMINAINDERVRLITQQKSGRPATPRNVGINASKAPYIALCDDDDIWEVNKLAIQVEALDKSKGVGMCYSNGQVLKNGVIQKGMLNRRKVFHHHFYQLLFGNFIPNSSVLIRKQVFETVGMINTNDTFRGIEDYEFWLRVSHEFDLLYIDQPLFQYRIHGNNITYSRSLETGRAIDVIKHVDKEVSIPRLMLLRALPVQYLKLFIYKLLSK